MIKLINGNGYEEIKKLKSNSIDFVLIDPPYKLDTHGGISDGHNLSRKLHENHINYISDGFDFSIFSEFIRVLKVVNIVIFCSNKQVSEIMQYWETKGYSTTLLVWKKPNPIPFGNGKYVSDVEYMIYIRGKGATYNNIGVKDQSKVFEYPSPSSKVRIHPTQKPVELLKRLLKIHTNENQIVLDVFCGSGSCGIACKELNRHFIGIELDKEMFDKIKID